MLDRSWIFLSCYREEIKPIQGEIENASTINFKLSNVYQGLVKEFREGGAACQLRVVSSKCKKSQLKVKFPIKVNLFISLFNNTKLFNMYVNAQTKTFFLTAKEI